MQKIVVITGASAGLGRATALAFAKKKYAIGLIARDIHRLEAVQKEVENLGGKALIIPMDVSDSNLMEMAAEKFEKELGPIDIWVNNAMTSVFSSAKQMTADEYKRVTEVTYLGYVYGTLAALKRMLPRDQGMIIQVGSALAYRSIPLQSAYCGAKFAIRGFTDSIRCELLHERSKVEISMIQMPALNTPQFDWVKSRLPRKAQPVPPIYQPELGADAIVWAADHYRREWVVGGSSTLAILGNKISPLVADWFLARQGYDAQQYDGLNDPNLPNNLYDTVLGNYTAHGDFDHLASTYSWQLWISRYRVVLLMIFLVIFFSFLFWEMIQNLT